MRSIEQRIKSTQAQLAALENTRSKLRANRRILCAACGEKHAIKSLHLIVTHYYIPPRGCTEGDYWLAGEWKFVCPTTQVHNRLLFNDYHLDHRDRDTVGMSKEATFKWIYRTLFKSTEEEHKGAQTAKWLNNFYVDENPKHFELPVPTKDQRR